ncbi:MAG TPA: PQQ-binding-like beta-propeller repeat protein [Verrucomicrobiae bacterium]|jgi:outer membrane protein assembly factor BamB
MFRLPLLAGFAFVFLHAAHANNWPQFRGPDGRAVAGSKIPTPAEFSPDKNVIWKTPLASGHSSPIVWGERIFLTTYDKGKLSAVCLDLRTGQPLWRKEVTTPKIEEFHRIGSPAASTACTDGERVYFYFGSFGLLCLDFSGKEVWRFPLPLPVNDFGTGTSPIVVDGRVFLARDQDVDSWLLALDARTGQQLWKTARPGFFRGHSTPFAWRHDGATEIVLTGSVRLKSYDLATGRELWTTTGLSRVANATPTSEGGLLFASSWNLGADATGRIELPPFSRYLAANDKNNDGRLTLAEFPKDDWRSRFTQLDADKDGFVTQPEWEAYIPIAQKAENALFAVRPGGNGDITASHVAWKKTRGLPYVPSPVCYEGRVYAVKSGGMVSCFDARTGRELYLEERVGLIGDFYASPVAADGKIYFTSQQGKIAVVAAEDSLNVLARNDLKEPIFATPAIVDGRVIVRTAGQLFCLGEAHRNEHGVAPTR